MTSAEPGLLLVTIDTNLLDDDAIERLRSAAGARVEFATVTVNNRERGGDLAAELALIVETAVWDESRWDEAVWGGPIPELFVLDETPLGSGVLAGDQPVDVFEAALAIISNGSFPKPGAREQMTDATQRQMRDAMSYEAHVRARRHVFVTIDTKGFIDHGRRDALERLGRTFIRTESEFLELGAAGALEPLRTYVSHHLSH